METITPNNYTDYQDPRQKDGTLLEVTLIDSRMDAVMGFSSKKMENVFKWVLITAHAWGRDIPTVRRKQHGHGLVWATPDKALAAVEQAEHGGKFTELHGLVETPLGVNDDGEPLGVFVLKRDSQNAGGFLRCINDVCKTLDMDYSIAYQPREHRRTLGTGSKRQAGAHGDPSAGQYEDLPFEE